MNEQREGMTLEKNGYWIRDGIEKFSLLDPYWTSLTYAPNNDEGVWDRDLEEHKNFDDGPLSMPPMVINDEYGGFGLSCQSEEELEDLGEFFYRMSDHELNQLQYRTKYTLTSKKRWFYNRGEALTSNFGDYGWWADHFTLYLTPINYKEHYYELRKLLLRLHEKGYLVKYKNNILM